MSSARSQVLTSVLEWERALLDSSADIWRGGGRKGRREVLKGHPDVWRKGEREKGGSESGGRGEGGGLYSRSGGAVYLIQMLGHLLNQEEKEQGGHKESAE